MDQCADVPCAEVVSVTETDSSDMLSFWRIHGHTIMHNTPCRHFAGRLTDLQFRLNYWWLWCMSFGWWSRHLWNVSLVTVVPEIWRRR